MTEIQRRAEVVLKSLAKAVAAALERKRRLGQYAVISRNGKPYRLLPEDLNQLNLQNGESENNEIGNSETTE